ncbi:hypothetical protein [Mesorhizobium xinjiangense]|uniref:hypothetical protein n=1 Tax=Mesorhizobium xinjiangense TaxID=2678685 RepID=UPI0012EE33E7|nr:hypothetical protein [Mesorhizobium xinjiangense]
MKDTLLARAHAQFVDSLASDIECGWVMDKDGPRPGTSDRATADRVAETLTLILDIEMAIGRQDMSGQPAWMPDVMHAGRLDAELFGKEGRP